MASDNVDVPVSVEFHPEGTVSLTFGPLAICDVADLLPSIGTLEFADSLITNLEQALHG